MAISVRLDRKTDALLGRLARDGKRSKSEVIRESIAMLALGAPSTPGGRENAYARLAPYIGLVASDGGLLASDMKERMRQRIRARNFTDRTR
jgi:Arc/MetJ-type ribon-helix-helix transcriptional regulator